MTCAAQRRLPRASTRKVKAIVFPAQAERSYQAELEAFVNAGEVDRDQHLLTREKFSIAYLGKLGDFVGRVYRYQRGDRTIGLTTHPKLLSL